MTEHCLIVIVTLIVIVIAIYISLSCFPYKCQTNNSNTPVSHFLFLSLLFFST